jgi:hypothetical protein
MSTALVRSEDRFDVAAFAPRLNPIDVVFVADNYPHHHA